MAERLYKGINGVLRGQDIATGGITIKEDGTTVETDVTELDFIGSGATATKTGTGTAQVDIPEKGEMPTIYDKTYEVTETITAGTAVSLPDNKEYNSDELQVWINGQRASSNYDYSFVGSIPRTQVSFSEDLQNGDKIRFYISRNYSDTPNIYDETLEVVSGTAGTGEIQGPISTGTLIALPNEQEYGSTDLQVYLNGSFMDAPFDINYESSTEISFTFDILVGDRIHFYRDRNY